MVRYKFVIGILLVLCLQPLRAFAQGSEPPIPSSPNGGNVVLDTLGWLTPSQESEINSINQKLDKEGIAQIAVVTLDDCGGDKQKFRNDLFRTWGIGHTNDNDGLLILVCWYGGDKSRRSVEQETGYGLEGTLPDILTARVVDEGFIPAFQANRPGDGLVAMVKRYDELLRQDVQISKTNPINSNNNPFDIKTAFLIIGALGILPGLALAITYSSIQSISTGMSNNVSGNRTNMPGVFEEVSTEGTSSWIYRFALAEILTLLPILGLIYFSQKNIYPLPPLVLAYIRFVFPFLIGWLIFLVLFYISKFVKAQNRRDYLDTRDDRDPYNNQQPSAPDLLDTLSDITSDLPSFGGGESGGGGSSKEF